MQQTVYFITFAVILCIPIFILWRENEKLKKKLLNDNELIRQEMQWIRYKAYENKALRSDLKEERTANIKLRNVNTILHQKMARYGIQIKNLSNDKNHYINKYLDTLVELNTTTDELKSISHDRYVLESKCDSVYRMYESNRKELSVLKNKIDNPISKRNNY